MDKFHDLDDVCLEGQARDYRMRHWGPYRRGKKVMRSYSATLGMILNTERGLKNRAEYAQIINSELAKKPRTIGFVRSILGGLKSKAQEKAGLPYWFVRYYLGK